MPQREWKFNVIELRFAFLSFRSLYLGILCLKKEQYLALWISAYLIYGDHQRGLFIKFIHFVQMFFGVLFSYHRTAKKRARWLLTWHSWNTTDLKIIGLFLLAFYIYNLHLSFAASWLRDISSRWEEITWFLVFSLLSLALKYSKKKTPGN